MPLGGPPRWPCPPVPPLGAELDVYAVVGAAVSMGGVFSDSVISFQARTSLKGQRPVGWSTARHMWQRHELW